MFLYFNKCLIRVYTNVAGMPLDVNCLRAVLSVCGQTLWCMVRHCSVWLDSVLYGQALCSMVRHCGVWSDIVVYGQTLWCICQRRMSTEICVLEALLFGFTVRNATYNAIQLITRCDA